MLKFINMITEIATKLDLREHEVLQILAVLTDRKSIGNQELVRLTGFPKANLGRFLGEISNYLEPPSQRVTVRPDAFKEMELVLREFRNIEDNRETEIKIKSVLAKYAQQRPKPQRSFDQFTATDETTIKRALYLKDRGDIYKRVVAFIGDDDLTSVAVALTGQAAKITVFEIDERLINLIHKISNDQNLKIEVVSYDTRHPLPNNYLGQYDTVFTDPPYTPNGTSLFLNRGVELIRQRLPSRIYLCYGNSDRAREKELEIQRLINEKGLLIKEKLAEFNKYYGAESIGSSSSLYLCDWTTKIRVTEEKSAGIYTND